MATRILRRWALAAVSCGLAVASCAGPPGALPGPVPSANAASRTNAATGDVASVRLASPGAGGASSGDAGAPEVCEAIDGAADAMDAMDATDATDGAALDPTAAAPPACPEAMAHLGRFCIDRWEAHLVVLGENGVAAPHAHVERPVAGERYAARSEPDVFPQGYISRVEATAACKLAGKRLCSMQEWLRACEGRRGTTYPYGQHVAAGRCNSGKKHLLQMRFGPDSHAWKYDEHFNSPVLDALPGFLAKTGAYEECVSDAGVFDLVGNLHEWVSDTVDQELVERVETEDVERHHQPWREGNGVFLGGFFSTNHELGPGCKYITYAHEPSYHDYSTGFRCCAQAQPEDSPKRPRGKRGERR